MQDNNNEPITVNDLTPDEDKVICANCKHFDTYYIRNGKGFLKAAFGFCFIKYKIKSENNMCKDFKTEALNFSGE